MEAIFDWYEVTPETVDFYGMDRTFVRMPDERAAAVSDGVRWVARSTAGGRIRFATDARSIRLRVQIAFCGFIGFDLYRLDGETELFAGCFRGLEGNCPFIEQGDFECKIYVDGYVAQNPGVHTYTLNFPYNAHPTRVELGLEKGSVLRRGAPYRNEKPVVFYGSSIVNGAWASRPGMTYPAQISQRLNLHYLNLGFSGLAKGEPAMAEYIAEQEMSAFVLDYDYNATRESLPLTHEPFYKTIRAAHPDIPVIIVTKPDYLVDPAGSELRAGMIRPTYENARARGENVVFIEGKTLFRGDSARNCSQDGTHPNDLGFYRMANVIGRAVAKSLGLTWPEHYDESTL